MTQVAFPDVKPFPAAPAAMGHNNPPLAESIVMDFEANLREHDGLIDRIEALRIKSESVKSCKNDDEAGRMGDFIKQCGAAVKVIEAEYEVLNRPMINARSALKAKSDHYVNLLQQAGGNVRKLLDVYLEDQERARRAEIARLAEIERQAEAERQRLIAEAQREAERVAEVERQRLQAIADEAARQERERQQAIENERALAEAREVKEVVVEAEVIEVAPEPVFIPEPEPVFVSSTPAKAPLRGDYGTSVSTVETWNVKVDNIRQVPDAYLKHPTVLEALEKVIRPLVRGKNGLREIKGCVITSSLSSSVRG